MMGNIVDRLIATGIEGTHGKLAVDLGNKLRIGCALFVKAWRYGAPLKEIFGAEEADAVCAHAATLGYFLGAVGVGEYRDVDAIACVGWCVGMGEGKHARGDIGLFGVS